MNLIVGAILCPIKEITPSSSKVIRASLKTLSCTGSLEPSLKTNPSCDFEFRNANKLPYFSPFKFTYFAKSV